MDFLKSLMLYMTLTFAASVQTAPAPEITPVPTAAPTAIVATAAPAGETPVGQATVTTPAPANGERPVPTITPNLSYRNVKMGDHGDRVKKLQKRLIELGYLTGEADGVFGNQTYRALLTFQKRNGLDRDGVAGDMTQTFLYENPDVIPAESTPTPPPTSTPAPEATLALPEASAAPALLEADVILNGAPLAILRQEDGVIVSAKPRLWDIGGEQLLSLRDMDAALEDWSLSVAENGTITLSAAGYAVVLTPADGAYACTVDGAAVTLDAGDVRLLDGEPVITAGFLEKALSAQISWDGEERAFLIQYTPSYGLTGTETTFAPLL